MNIEGICCFPALCTSWIGLLTVDACSSLVIAALDEKGITHDLTYRRVSLVMHMKPSRELTITLKGTIISSPPGALKAGCFNLAPRYLTWHIK